MIFERAPREIFLRHRTIGLNCGLHFGSRHGVLNSPAKGLGLLPAGLWGFRVKGSGLRVKELGGRRAEDSGSRAFGGSGLFGGWVSFWLSVWTRQTLNLQGLCRRGLGRLRNRHGSGWGNLFHDAFGPEAGVKFRASTPEP